MFSNIYNVLDIYRLAKNKVRKNYNDPDSLQNIIDSLEVRKDKADLAIQEMLRDLYALKLTAENYSLVSENDIDEYVKTLIRELHGKLEAWIRIDTLKTWKIISLDFEKFSAFGITFYYK